MLVVVCFLRRSWCSAALGRVTGFLPRSVHNFFVEVVRYFALENLRRALGTERRDQVASDPFTSTNRQCGFKRVDFCYFSCGCCALAC